MDTQKWDILLVETFKRFEDLRNLISIREESEGCLDPKALYEEYFFCEAILCVYDPYMVGYVHNEKDRGLYTFIEARAMEEKYLGQGKLFFYYPIIFPSMYDYMQYVTGDATI